MFRKSLLTVKRNLFRILFQHVITLWHGNDTKGNNLYHDIHFEDRFSNDIPDYKIHVVI